MQRSGGNDVQGVQHGPWEERCNIRLEILIQASRFMNMPFVLLFSGGRTRHEVRIT